MQLRIAVLGGGESPEHEISLVSAAEVVRGYLDLGARVLPVYLDREGGFHLLEERSGPGRFSARDLAEEGRRRRRLRIGAALDALAGRGVDLVFPALHGPRGEDGFVQTHLEGAGLPYVGSGPLASALGMSKSRSRLVFLGAGLPVARGLVPRAEECRRLTPDEVEAWCREEGLDYPLYLKTDDSGSSLGVHRVRDRESLERALADVRRRGRGWILEEEVRGIECTCAVLGDAGGPLEALPVVEIRPKKKDAFFDYETKYDPQLVEELCPAPSLDAAAERAVRALAVRAHEVLGCRSLSRSDFILSGENPILLETNTMPGLTPQSLLPKAAKAAGLSFTRLLERLAREAFGAAGAAALLEQASSGEGRGGGDARA